MTLVEALGLGVVQGVAGFVAASPSARPALGHRRVGATDRDLDRVSQLGSCPRSSRSCSRAAATGCTAVREAASRQRLPSAIDRTVLDGTTPLVGIFHG